MLAKKMRITAGTVVHVLNAPKDYEQVLGALPEKAQVKRDKLDKQNDFIHLFVHDKAELEQKIATTWAALAERGLLWISYPKKTSGLQTDLSRDKGWDCLSQFSLEWLALISFDDQWSAFLARNNPSMKNGMFKEKGHSDEPVYYDAATKTVIIPDDLAEAFKQEKKAKAIFDAYAYSHRKEYVGWIISAKRPETRMTRVAKTIEMLLSGKKNPADK